MENRLTEHIFAIDGAGDFDSLAMEVFRFQYGHNHVYRQFCDALGRAPSRVSDPAGIPFLPVEFFKQHRVVSCGGEADIVFSSSGTTGSVTSRHYVKEVSLYRHSFTEGFRHFYGEPAGLCILALLPSYLERADASLVYMAKGLMEQSGHPDNGFYLRDLEGLHETLERLRDSGQPTLLLGVSFALLDLAEAHPTKMTNTLVMETGGMKGRRREMVREELHASLKQAFGVEAIHSEYGMTELLSQAYSKADGLFSCPPWMKVLIRDNNDPITMTDGSRPGGINVIDLANIYSCSFLATQDLGKTLPDGRFEVLGRFDNSDVRGCNLMAG